MTPDCVTGAPSATVSISELAGWSGLELVARLPDGSIRRGDAPRAPSGPHSQIQRACLFRKGEAGRTRPLPRGPLITSRLSAAGARWTARQERRKEHGGEPAPSCSLREASVAPGGGHKKQMREVVFAASARRHDDEVRPVRKQKPGDTSKRGGIVFGSRREGRFEIPKPAWREWDREKTRTSANDPQRAYVLAGRDQRCSSNQGSNCKPLGGAISN